MGYVYPLAKMSPEQYARFLGEALTKAEKDASTYIKASKIIFRELKPKDLGIDSNEWVFNLNAGENVVVSDYELDDKTLIIITEIAEINTDPIVTEVIFGDPAKTKDDFFIEFLHQFSPVAAALRPAPIYQPGKKPVIKLVAKKAGTTKFVFRGFVFEPAGRTISI